MKNEATPQNTQHKNRHYLFTPLITTTAIPVIIGRRKKTETAQEKTPKTNPKPKGLTITKYDLSDNVVKFFATQGFLKKASVILKEIPILEIKNIESFGNELNATWKGIVYSFVFKQKSESFRPLQDQIQGLLEEQQHTIESNEKFNLRNSSLTGTINTSIGIVDICFDILIRLHEKRVDWTLLESYANSLGDSLNLKAQTLPPFNLNFAKVSAAIKKQVPQETAKEVYNILKSIYAYFEGLKPDDDLKENSLRLQNANAVILAYYTLNDLLLGKVIGETDIIKESLALKSVLLGLANQSNVKVNFDELNESLGRLDFKADSENVVEHTRAIFKEPLKQP